MGIVIILIPYFPYVYQHIRNKKLCEFHINYIHNLIPEIPWIRLINGEILILDPFLITQITKFPDSWFPSFQVNKHVIKGCIFFFSYCILFWNDIRMIKIYYYNHLFLATAIIPYWFICYKMNYGMFGHFLILPLLLFQLYIHLFH